MNDLRTSDNRLAYRQSQVDMFPVHVIVHGWRTDCVQNCRNSNLRVYSETRERLREISARVYARSTAITTVADPENRAGGAKGVWDAVDTILDLGVKMSSRPSKWLVDITGGRHERN